MGVDGAWTTSRTIGLRSATGSDDPNKIRGVQLDSLEATFDRDGYVVVCAGLESAFVDLALEHLSRIRAVRLSSQTAAFVTAPPGDATAAGLATQPALVALVGTVLDTTPSCFGFTYFPKRAPEGLQARWHQDLGPWAAALAGSGAVTAWVALTDADRARGCLRVVRGSHLGAAHELVADTSRRTMFGIGIADGLVDERGAVTLAVSAGDVVLHHPNVIHSSDANRSAVMRVALAVRYRSLRPAENVRRAIVSLVASSDAALGVDRVGHGS